MKSFLIGLSLLTSVSAFADKCVYQADATAKAVMRLNNEKKVSTEVGNVQHISDDVNTDYYTYDVVGLSKSGKVSTLTYRVSIDYNNSCRVLGLEILGGN